MTGWWPSVDCRRSVGGKRGGLTVVNFGCKTNGWHLVDMGQPMLVKISVYLSHLDTCRFFWCRLDSNRSQWGFATNESQIRIAFVRFRLDSQVAEFFYFPWAPGESTRHVHEVFECCDVLCLSLTLRGFARTVGGCAFIMQLADQEETSLFCKKKFKQLSFSSKPNEVVEKRCGTVWTLRFTFGFCTP